MISVPEITDVPDSGNKIYVELPDNQKYLPFPTNNLLTSESDIEIPILDIKLVNEGAVNRKKKFKESISEKLSKKTKTKESIITTLMKPKNNLIKSMKTKSLVRNALQKLKRTKQYQDYSQLSAYHFKIINDHSAFFFEKEKPTNSSLLSRMKKSGQLKICLPGTKLFQCLKYSIKKILKLLPIFSPLMWPKITWDIFISLLVFFQFFSFTMEFFFFVDLELRTFRIFLMFMFIMDILIHLNTRIFKNGVEVSSRRLIFKNLIHQKFFSVIMPTLMMAIINIFSYNKNLSYLNLILILKIGKARKNVDHIQEILINNENALISFKLIKMVIKIFIFGHMIACLWHFVGYLSNDYFPERNNWLRNKGIINDSWKLRYLYSIYWSVTTMLSVGYGDITASNEIETMFNTFAMFIGCCVFGYSVTIMNSIFKQATRKAAILDERMSKVNFMLRGKKLPVDTQNKIKKYLGFVWKQEQIEDPEDEALIMNKLSSKLRDEIYLHTNVNYLESFPAFKSFSGKALLCLARAMKKVRVSPEEHVYREGEQDNLGIYFVVEGDLQLVTERGSMRTKPTTKWKTFKKKEFFGDDETFSGGARNFSVVSNKFSTLFFLKRSDMLLVLKSFPKDYERFCQIRDLEIIYNKEEVFCIKCDSCGYYDHKLKNCPFIRFMPNKFKIIETHLRKSKRKTKNFKRKGLTTENALLEKETNTRMASEFLSVYGGDEDLEFLLNIYSHLEKKPAAFQEKTDEGKLSIPKPRFNHDSDNLDYASNIVQEDSQIFARNANKRGSIYAGRGMQGNKTFIKKFFPQREANPGGTELERELFRRRQHTNQTFIHQTAPNAFLTPGSVQALLLNEQNDNSTEADGNSTYDRDYLRDKQGAVDSDENKIHDHHDIIYHRQIQADDFEKEAGNTLEFDRVKSFDNYFPGKNVEHLMSKMNKMKTSV